MWFTGKDCSKQMGDILCVHRTLQEILDAVMALQNQTSPMGFSNINIELNS
jgi:hypothetical protein